MRMSSLGSDFRKVSAKLRTDLRLPRSSCMNTTSLLPLSWWTVRKVMQLLLRWSGMWWVYFYGSECRELSFGRKQIRFVLTLLISSRAASPLCLLRQARITLAPLLARSMAVVLPMPVLLPRCKKRSLLMDFLNVDLEKKSLYLPVTITVLPCSFAVLVQLFPFTTTWR